MKNEVDNKDVNELQANNIEKNSSDFQINQVNQANENVQTTQVNLQKNKGISEEDNKKANKLCILAIIIQFLPYSIVQALTYLPFLTKISMDYKNQDNI